MARFQAGEAAVFDDLYAALVPAVRGFLRRSLQRADRVEDRPPRLAHGPSDCLASSGHGGRYPDDSALDER